MGLYQDLPVFADIYTLTHPVFLLTQDYPREYKFTLGQDMKRDGLVLLRSIYRINKSTDKLAHLEAFLDDFELLKLEIRLSGDLKLLPTKKHSQLIVLMDSIGKQITGWRNFSLSARISPARPMRVSNDFAFEKR